MSAGVSGLSDDDLMRALGQGSAGPVSQGVSGLSDADLMKALGQDQPLDPKTAEIGDLLTRSGQAREQGRQAGVKSGAANAFGTGANAGVTMNFGDELAGVSRASGLPDWTPPAIAAPIGAARIGLDAAGLGSGTATQAYEDQRDYARGYQQGAQEAHPVAEIAGQFAGGIAPAVATAPMIAGTLPARLLAATGVGAGLGATQGFGEGEGFEDRRQHAETGAKWGAALGPAGEIIGTGVGKALNRSFGAASEAAPRVVPAERIAAADEFAVPLSRGQATGNEAQQAWEEAARNNARGEIAKKVVGGFDERQRAAIETAKQGVGESLGGQPTAFREGGEQVAQGIQARAEALRSGADAAYGRAAGKQAEIGLPEVGNLAKRVSDTLAEGGIVIDPNYGSYGGASAAMNLLRRVSGFDGAPDGAVAQSLQGIEQARKGLIKIAPTNGEDYRALKAIRSTFDDWMSDAIDGKLFSGDASALDDLKQARELWSSYKGLTRGEGSDGAKIVGKIATEERTGEEVANWLLGAANAGQAGRAARAAVEIRGALGREAPEWEALRQMAWTKMTNPARGEGPQAVSSSILDFVRGPGAPVARQLFSEKEIGQMSRLAGVIRSTVPAKGATNPSKSGYEVARLLGGYGAATGAGGLAAAFSGDPKYLAIAALPLLKSGQALSKAVAATRATPSRAAQSIGRYSRVPALAAPGALGVADQN